MVATIASTLRLAVLTMIPFTAANPEQTLDWPFGPQSELPSPDGQHTVYGEPYKPGVREGPELWLRHRGRAERKRLLQLGSTADVVWFRDSRNFLIVDREGSSSMASYIYDLEGEIVLDMRAGLLRYDPELGPLASGHFYVEAQRLLGPNTVRAAAFGHTDEAPVRCFRFIYSIKRNGKIERLSKRVTPATATACDERSE